MFSHALAGARAAGLVLFAAALLGACGSDDPAETPPVALPAARLVVDTGSAAPVAGGTFSLKATLLAADGSEVKGASVAWTSSNESVATVLSASDRAPAAAGAAPVGIYATIRTLAAGEADITATATLADGSRVASVTHLVVQAAPAKSYTLALTPATLAVTAGAAAQTVAVSVRRSDGVDGAADLANWSWTSDDASFVVATASDGHSARVASPASATAAASATLTACADAPAGRLCANAALSRAATPPAPTYSVGGTVSGLAAGKSLQLNDGNGDVQLVNANGAFAMPTSRPAATPYAVTVSGQPAGQTCTVANGIGTLPAANVTNIAITCVQAQFVVVANRDDRTISVYRVDPRNGALAPVPGSPFPSGGAVNDMAFLPSGLVGLAVMVDTNTVMSFRLDPATGAMSAIAGTSTFTAYGAPHAVAVHPSGNWALIGAGTGVSAYAIDPATYALTFVSGAADGSGTGQTYGVALSRDGAHVYGANSRRDHVLKVTLDPTSGGFGPLAFLPTGGTGPNRLVVSPSGSHVYVANSTSASLGVGTIGSDGLLTAVNTYPTTAATPVDIALTPSGDFAYLLGTGSSSIVGYRLDPSSADGLPVAVVGTTPAGGNGQRLSIDPNGRYLYTTALSGSILGFAIDASTGTLTPVPGSPFAAGNVNTAVVIVEPKP